MKEAVEIFVNNFCETALDFSKDMMADMPDEYKTFNEVSSVLENSIQSFTESCLEDYLDQFTNEVREALRSKMVNVISVSFNEEGYEDSVEIIKNKSLVKA